MKTFQLSVFLLTIIVLFCSISTKILQKSQNTLKNTSKDTLKNEPQKYKIKTIVIDAGHGGSDPGALGKVSYEKQVTLAVSLKLGELLAQHLPEIKVIQTRSKDTHVKLYERATVANKNAADLFISIHCNSLDIKKTPKNKAVAGTEVFIMGAHVSEENLAVAKRENSVILKETDYKKNYGGFDPNSPQSHIMLVLEQNAYLENSLKLADFTDKQLKDKAKRTNRGLKQAGFIVLKQATMPSMLVEIGFMTNEEEEKFMNTADGQEILASALLRAIKDYKKEVER